MFWLPSHLSKKILMMLDYVELNVAAKVSRSWEALAAEVRAAKEHRQDAEDFVLDLQAQCDPSSVFRPAILACPSALLSSSCPGSLIRRWTLAHRFASSGMQPGSKQKYQRRQAIQEAVSGR